MVSLIIIEPMNIFECFHYVIILLIKIIKMIIMNGYKSKYLYYEANKQSIVTIPRAILDANNLKWIHKEDVNIIYKELNGQPGLFLFKNKKNKKKK